MSDEWIIPLHALCLKGMLNTMNKEKNTIILSDKLQSMADELNRIIINSIELRGDISRLAIEIYQNRSVDE